MGGFLISLCATGGFAQAGHDAPLIGIYSGINAQQVAEGVSSGATIFYPSIDWTGTHNAAVKEFVALSHEKGIKVYPSLATAIDGENSEFAKQHPQYWEKMRDGSLQNTGHYAALSYSHPEVRAYKVKTIVALVQETGVDGVLLDYTRFFTNQSGYCDKIVEDFRKATGRDAMKVEPSDPQWVQFRADYVTQFVSELRTALHEFNPRLEIIACVGPDPKATLNASLQDWGTWLDKGLIDGVTPMIYERDTNTTLDQIKTAQAFIQGRVPLIPLIACWGDNLDTPEMLYNGSVKTLQTGVEGVAYYRTDAIRNLNLYPTIAEVSKLKLSEIRQQPINYLENTGFEQQFEHWAIGLGNGITLTDDAPFKGKASLRMNFADQPVARQLIDRGWIGDGKAINVSANIRSQGTGHAEKLFFELRQISNSGTETASAFPVTLNSDGNWHSVNASFPLSDTANLKVVILSLVTQGSQGTVDFDGMSLSFGQESPDLTALRDAPADPKTSTDTSRNVALGALVQASSFWENGFEPSNAVNGKVSSGTEDKGNSWYSQRPARDQWLKVYLDRPEKVTRFRLLNAAYQSAYRTSKFRIEVSTDDKNYKTVATGSLADNATDWTELRISPVEARYVRFVGIIGYNPDYAIGLSEFEIYAD